MKNIYSYLRLLCVMLFPFLTHVSNAAPVTVPYECAFASEDDMAGWLIYNRDDDASTWFMSTSDYGGAGIESKASAGYAPTDNWLVTPGLQLKAGDRYQLSFMAYIAYYCEEKMRITVGTSPEPEAQTTILQEVVIPKHDGYYGYKVALLLPEMPSGTYYIGLQYYTDSNESMCVCINKFKIETMQEGTVSGKVINSAGQPMRDVDVKLGGEAGKTAKTDIDGLYTFNAVTQGEYTISAKSFGYKEATRTVSVIPESTTTCDITLEELRKGSLSGTVKDKNGNGVAGASIRLSGYDDYRAVTDASGNYTIGNVYIEDEPAQYTATVYKNFFNEATKTASLSGQGGNTCDFTLEGKAVAPYEVTVSSTDDAATADVKWKRPADMTELGFDNGVPKAGMSLGFDNSHADTNILGIVFREPMTVYGAKWYMTTESRATQVNVNILEIDAGGNPTGKVIYTQADVPFKLGEWTSVTFPAPVICPNGFIIALSSEGHISLAVDTNTGIIGDNTQFYSNTMNSADAFTYFEDVEWSGAMLIRADGERYEPDAAAPEMKYNVYRFADTDKEDESLWTKIGTDINAEAMTDTRFGEIPAGTYRYAVSAINAIDGVESGKTMSAAVHSRCYTRVVVNVTANSIPADAVGATVTLSDGESHVYTATVESDNKAIIDNVWKGTYSITAEQPGFTADLSTIDLSANEEYKIDVELCQILAPVTNIDCDESPEGHATTLRWDLYADIYDDFESKEYKDFEINPAGKTGWDYIDNDNMPTYGFSGSEFPGMGDKMAAILMNGSAVVPPVTTNIAHSGDRALAFFACRAQNTEGGIQTFDSDDYLISPELCYHKDFTLSFHARTYQPQDGVYERFRVGYSLSGKTTGDFVWLTGYITAPEAYTYYEYTIPKEARFITINSSSPNGFIFLLDDIRLTTGILHSGEEPSHGETRGYNIYVDRKHTAHSETNEYTLDWSTMQAGTHTVGVTKVYASGESSPLEITVNVTASGIEVAEAGAVSMTMRHNNILSVRGSHNGVTVYTAAGNTVAKAPAMATALDLSSLPRGIYVAHAQVEGASAAISKITVR